MVTNEAANYFPAKKKKKDRKKRAQVVSVGIDLNYFFIFNKIRPLVNLTIRETE
jgi:hypothetical protein